MWLIFQKIFLIVDVAIPIKSAPDNFLNHSVVLDFE